MAVLPPLLSCPAYPSTQLAWPQLLCAWLHDKLFKAQAEPRLPAAPAHGHNPTLYLPSIKLFIPVVNHGLDLGQPAVFDGVLTDS